MKKGIRFHVVLCVLLVSVLFLCSGCSSQEEEATPNVETINITLSIDYPNQSNRTDIKEVAFKLEEDTTVLQLIELYGNVNNLSILVDTTHSTLEGINGVNNGAYWKKGEWKFTINEKFTSKPEGEKTLENGDFVQFIYVKE